MILLHISASPSSSPSHSCFAIARSSLRPYAASSMTILTFSVSSPISNTFLMDPDCNQLSLALCAHHYLRFPPQPPQSRSALHACALSPRRRRRLSPPTVSVFSHFCHGPLNFLGLSKKTGGDVVGTTTTPNTTTTLYLHTSNCIYSHNTIIDMCTRLTHTACIDSSCTVLTLTHSDDQLPHLCIYTWRRPNGRASL